MFQQADVASLNSYLLSGQQSKMPDVFKSYKAGKLQILRFRKQKKTHFKGKGQMVVRYSTQVVEKVQQNPSIICKNILFPHHIPLHVLDTTVSLSAHTVFNTGPCIPLT